MKVDTVSNFDGLEYEIEDCEFKDKRLGKRFHQLTKTLWGNIGKSIPFACQDWANTKAAYRFFSNENVGQKEILRGHFRSTQERFNKTNQPFVLILHDTTEFSYKRKNPTLGGICQMPGTKSYSGNRKPYTVRGILMHSSFAVTTQGLPLGLTAIKFWTRKKFKGCNALKGHVNTAYVPIAQKESIRWLENVEESTNRLNDSRRCVHIGDRESDIYELFSTAQEANTFFLVRTFTDRLCEEGVHRVSEEMEEVSVKGLHHIKLTDKKGETVKAMLEVKYRRLRILPPEGKRKKYPPLFLTVIHAVERNPPKNRDPIIWKLLTNLSITSCKEAVEKLKWYSMRWKIETFHKILKSGCKVEESKLRSADRLVNLISLCCILSWRIFWMTMINRLYPEARANLVLTSFEINLFDQLVKDNQTQKKGLSYYLTKIAKLGGYLGRTSDPPPGNMVMWKGLSRLTDIVFGFNMALKIVGN